jgi:hypothetical protein
VDRLEGFIKPMIGQTENFTQTGCHKLSCYVVILLLEPTIFKVKGRYFGFIASQEKTG